MYRCLTVPLLFKTVSIRLLHQTRCVQLDKTVLKTQQLPGSGKGYRPVCDFPSQFFSLCDLSRDNNPSDLYRTIRAAREDEECFHLTSAAVSSSRHASTKDMSWLKMRKSLWSSSRHRCTQGGESLTELSSSLLDAKLLTRGLRSMFTSGVVKAGAKECRRLVLPHSLNYSAAGRGE